MIKDLVKSLPGSVKRMRLTPAKDFHSDAYIRIDQRRLEHLASLRLDLRDKTVLEVGAGIGDLTSFFLDRGCRVVSTDGRLKNLRILQSRLPEVEGRLLDLDRPDPAFEGRFDVVFAYGILYHLGDPEGAISFMADRCSHLLLLETCVSFGDEARVNLCKEHAKVPSQSVSGTGCRPTRRWIFDQLKKHIRHVYMPVTQPNFKQFPLDWAGSPPKDQLTRAVFVASREPIDNDLLVEEIPIQQRRH